MKYFTLFPKLNYSFSNGEYLNLTNIFIRPNIKLAQIPGVNTTGNKYVVEDGDSADTIAFQFYENSDLFWCVLATNDILDIYKEWPVSFDLWKKELSSVHGNYTFFTPYFMDIKPGDIVSKYTGSQTQFFDKNNFGVVIETNPFFRSFDVDFVKGQITEQQSFVILRKNGSKFVVIKTPNDEIYQILKKRQEKLNSTVNFLTKDKNSTEKTIISPYSIFNSNENVLSTIDDITGTNCILDDFINNTLSFEILPVSFSEEAQKEWIFNKSINIIPGQYLNQINEIYLNTLGT